jgi:hypothetical protein
MAVQEDGPLFKLLAKFIKYFALFLFVAAVTFVLSSPFGFLNLAVQLFPFVFYGVMRLALVLFCLTVLVIIFESLQ